jgi:hypothetical protein
MASIVIAERTFIACNCMRAARWGGTASAGRSATTSQTVASKLTRTSIHRRTISLNSRAFEAYNGSGEQRQALSTPSTSEPPHQRLAGTYPYSSKQSIPAFPTRYPAATAVQPKLARKRAYTVFPIEYAFIAGPTGAPLCKISF